MKTWRQNQRRRLIEERAALSADDRRQITDYCLAHISDYLSDCKPAVIGLYWPIKGELDCRPLAEPLLKAGWILSLPVINNETGKLDFARWQPATSMTAGIWNIPVPTSPEWLSPTRFLVPLVGFDIANYRLGYGGGYYDRTLADKNDDVETIGVGMEMGRFDSIHPHALDIPMRRIITEAGIQLPEPQNDSAL